MHPVPRYTQANSLPLELSHLPTISHTINTMTTFLTSLFRSAPQVSSNNPLTFPYTPQSNPYRAKRTWPPDFSQLSSKHQFRLERRYRRRSKLKYTRPRWNAGVKLAQWGAILFVVTYGVFYLEVEEIAGGRKLGEKGGGGSGSGRTIYDAVRGWYEGQVEGLRSSREGEAVEKG